MTQADLKFSQAKELSERMKRRFTASYLVNDREIMQFVAMFLVAMEEFEKMRAGQ